MVVASQSRDTTSYTRGLRSDKRHWVNLGRIDFVGLAALDQRQEAALRFSGGVRQQICCAVAGLFSYGVRLDTIPFVGIVSLWHGPSRSIERSRKPSRPFPSPYRTSCACSWLSWRGKGRCVAISPTMASSPGPAITAISQGAVRPLSRCGTYGTARSVCLR